MQVRSRKETLKGEYHWGCPEGDNCSGLARVITVAPFMNTCPQQMRQKERRRMHEKTAEGGVRKSISYWLGPMTSLILDLSLAQHSAP